MNILNEHKRLNEHANEHGNKKVCVSGMKCIKV